MTRASDLSLLLLGMLAERGSGVAQEGIDIEHKPVGCIVAGKYPKLTACFSPAGKLARSRVYFRPEKAGRQLVLRRDEEPISPASRASFPSRRSTLIGQKVLYYIDAFDQQFAENRTPDKAAEVVKSEGECRKDIPIAPIVSNATVDRVPGHARGLRRGGAQHGRGRRHRRRGRGRGRAVGWRSPTRAAAGAAIRPPPRRPPDGRTSRPRPRTTTTTTTTTTLAPARTPFQPSFRINPDPAHGQRSP